MKNILIAATVFLAATAGAVNEMPVVFSKRKVSRVCHDIPVACDLRTARAFAFDFRCDDPSVIAGFGFYFKSGPEWYYADEFEPGRPGEWKRIEIRKTGCRKGNGALGWDKIDAVRFSFWCNGTNDTVCAVSGMAAVTDTAPAVIVLKSETKQISDFINCPRPFVRCLEELGVAHAVISDTEIKDGDFADGAVVALPYNPVLTDKAVELLKTHVERGGKVITSGSVPDAVRKITGFKPAGGGYWPRSQRKTPLKGMRRAGKGLAGQPPFVETLSLGAGAIALSGPGEIVAEWVDENGKDIGLPAVLRTPAGFVISRYWYGGTGADSCAMMAAMLSDMVPSLGNGLGRSVEKIRRRRTVSAAGVAAGKTGKLGAWCMGQWRAGGLDWDTALGRLKAKGVSFIVPYMCDAASAAYRSKVLGERKAVKTGGDALDLCLAACRKHGIECHVWKMFWMFDASADAEFSRKMEKEGRLQIDRSGQVKKNWLCPSDPRNVCRESDAMVELALRGVDGVQYDFMRYNDASLCYCPRCKAKFEKKAGRTLEPWPRAASASRELVEAWNTFRCDTISSFVRDTSARIRREAPGVKISAAVFGDTRSSPIVVGQDWIPWAENGWVDFACPMTYFDDCGRYRRSLSALRKRTKIPLYPGIGATVWSPDEPSVLAERMARQRDIASSLGFAGCTVFELDLTAQDMISRQPSSVPGER